MEFPHLSYLSNSLLVILWCLSSKWICSIPCTFPLTQVPCLWVGVVAGVSQFLRVEGVEGVIMAVLFSLSHFALQIFSSLHVDVFALCVFYMEFKSPLIICPAANF